MQRKYYGALLVACLFIFAACLRTVQHDGVEEGQIAMSHSVLLNISECDGTTMVGIDNPWDREQKLATYQLIAREDSAVIKPVENVVPLYVPLRRCVVLQLSPHSELIRNMGCADAIALESEQSGIALLESLVALDADAIFASSFQDNPAQQLAERSGIPLIQCADYLEPTALGRAEWVRFYGRLFGKKEEADSLFQMVLERYDSLRTLVGKTNNRPKVLTELIYQGIWYVPAPQSTKAQIIADAGGEYVFGTEHFVKQYKQKGSSVGALSLSPEVVLQTAADADVWTFTTLLPSSATMLEQTFKGYAEIKAFRTGNIWQCPTAKVPYFEKTAFRPDLILQEYISLIHPEISDFTPQYYQRVKTKE